MNKPRKKTSEQQKAKWRGKNFERRVAELLGGVVVGRSKAVNVGKGHFIEVDPNHPPDVLTSDMSVECKHTKIPASIRRAVAQAERNAPASSGCVPIVFWGDREGNNIIIVDEETFLSAFGRIASPNPVGHVDP